MNWISRKGLCWWRGRCFCTTGVPGGRRDGKGNAVLVVQSDLVWPVSYLLECPGGSQNPCSGHGTCLDGIQQNGTCICKVSAWFILRVMCFCQRELCSVCADALAEGWPSAWKVISSFFHSSISLRAFPGGLVCLVIALRHCWWGYGVVKGL